MLRSPKDAFFTQAANRPCPCTVHLFSMAAASKTKLYFLKFSDEYGGHRAVTAQLTVRQAKSLSTFMGSKADHAQVFQLNEDGDEDVAGQLILLEQLDDSVTALFTRLYEGIDSTALVHKVLEIVASSNHDKAELKKEQRAAQRDRAAETKRKQTQWEVVRDEITMQGLSVQHEDLGKIPGTVLEIDKVRVVVKKLFNGGSHVLSMATGDPEQPAWVEALKYEFPRGDDPALWAPRPRTGQTTSVTDAQVYVYYQEQ